MNPRILTVLCALLFIVGCNGSDDSDDLSTDSSSQSSCENWHQYQYDSFIFENNQWNSDDVDGDDFEQCITLTESAAGDYTPSWSWDWPYGGGSVKAYPEIWYGDKFTTQSANSAELPEMISALADYQISFAYSETGIDEDDIRNVAFESWFFPTEDVSFDEVAYEMMVWVNKSDDFYAAGSLVDSVTFSDGRYDLYLAYFDDWTYFAYVRQDGITEGSLNWNEFVDYLVDEGYISSDHYMSGIEFGTEIIYGQGEFQIDAFEISIAE